MIKNHLKINNPLTIIAVFSMLTEASAAVSLPYIDSEHQKEYVWFLIIFPVLLVTLFFLTLNFNNKTLYTPANLSKAALPLTTAAYTPRTYTDFSTDTLLSKPAYQLGIKFSSFTPHYFTFLPQGHRTYDSASAKPSGPNNAPTLFSTDKLVLFEGTKLKNFHLIDLNHSPSLRSFKNFPKDRRHRYCKSPRKCKNNTHKNDVFLLLKNTPPGITPGELMHTIFSTHNATPTDHTTLITYTIDTRKLDIFVSP